MSSILGANFEVLSSDCIAGMSYLPAATSTDGCSSGCSDGVRGRIRPRQRQAIDTFCLMDEQLRDLPLQRSHPGEQHPPQAVSFFPVVPHTSR